MFRADSSDAAAEGWRHFNRGIFSANSGEAPGKILAMAQLPDTHIRSFRPDDLEACQKLYREGMIGGKIADNDTGMDIDDISHAYMRLGNHFWVAERGTPGRASSVSLAAPIINPGIIHSIKSAATNTGTGEVGSENVELGPASAVGTCASPIVGMVGVQQDGDDAAGVRRLRVRSDCRRQGVGTALMESALQFCHDHGYLKVTLDTFMDPEVAIRMFERFRFHHDRSRTVNGKDLMYFYFDLYTASARPGKGETPSHSPQG